MAALAIAAVLTLGTGIVVKGQIEAWLPWREIAKLPVFDNILPTRFAVYGSLAAALIVAFWAASRRGFLRYALPALAVAALVPNLSHADYRDHPERWAFFTQGLYKLCIKKNENVAIFPFGFWTTRPSGRPRPASGSGCPRDTFAPNPPPEDIDDDPTIQMLTYTTDNPTPAQIIGLRPPEEGRPDRLGRIYVHPNGTEMHRFGSVQGLGGVAVAPGCGYPSMQKGIHPTPPHPTH